MTLGVLYHMPFWQAANGSLWEAEGSFARYVDSLAPYFDEVLLAVPAFDAPQSGGSRVRSPNVRLSPLPYFPGPRQFYPALPAIHPRLRDWVGRCDVLNFRVPTPAAAFAQMFCLGAALLAVPLWLHATGASTATAGAILFALPAVMAALAAMIVTGAAVAILGLEEAGVKTIGAVVAGLPSIRVPAFPAELLPSLSAEAAGVALIGFSSMMLTARSFAAKNRYEIDADREFAALGAANIATALSQGFAVSGADSRTAMNDAAGGKTRVAGLVAARHGAGGLGRLLRRLAPLRRHQSPRLRSSTSVRSATTRSRSLSESPRICCRPMATCGMYLTM